MLYASGMQRSLRHSSKAEPIVPVDIDDLEDTMALYYGKEPDRARFFQTATLVPMLGTMAAVLGDQECLNQLDEIAPRLKGVTKERWFTQKTLEN